MSRHVTAALYVLVIVATIISVDFLFFRSWFWGPLVANVGIVLVFAAFYLLFFRSR